MILGGSALGQLALAEFFVVSKQIVVGDGGVGRHRRRRLTLEQLEEGLKQQRSFTPQYWREMNAAWDAQEEAERKAEDLKKRKEKAALARAARIAAEALNAAEAARAEAWGEARELIEVRQKAAAAARAKTTAERLRECAALERAAKALHEYTLMLEDDEEVSLLLM